MYKSGTVHQSNLACTTNYRKVYGKRRYRYTRIGNV